MVRQRFGDIRMPLRQLGRTDQMRRNISRTERGSPDDRLKTKRLSPARSRGSCNPPDLSASKQRPGRPEFGRQA